MRRTALPLSQSCTPADRNNSARSPGVLFPAEAGRQAVEAGLDLEAPSEFGFGDRLLELIREGRLAEELIDRSVSRILRAKFLLGLFENPYADTKAVGRTVHRPEHRRLARRIADNLVARQFHKGFFLPGANHLFAKFDDATPLALLYLEAALRDPPVALPPYCGGHSFFHCDYEGQGRTYDGFIYGQTRGE